MTEDRRAAGALACAVLVLAATMGGCAVRGGDEYVFAIEQAFVTSPRGADLTGVVPGEWDRMCVFRPGTRVEVVDSVHGTRWARARATRIDTDTDATLLTFVRGGEVLDYVLYPVEKGEFGTPGAETWYCVPRERARFELRQPIHGGPPWIGPVEGW